jgi:hypothetical protein
VNDGSDDGATFTLYLDAMHVESTAQLHRWGM